MKNRFSSEIKQKKFVANLLEYTFRISTRLLFSYVFTKAEKLKSNEIKTVIQPELDCNSTRVCGLVNANGVKKIRKKCNF